MTYRTPSQIIHNGQRLSEALEAHELWMGGDTSNGKRIDLRDADLWSANLRGANLRDARLRDADLRVADLWSADLRGADLRGASLWGANLRGANLRDADLRGADLWGANGNMIEVKSAQFDTWPLTWTTSPDGEVILQIGCQSHSLELWEKSDPRWIAALDDCATEWWSKYRDAVLSLVKASPATPYAEAAQ